MNLPSMPESPLTNRSDYEYLTLDIAALSQNKKINRYGYVIAGAGFLVPENTLSEVLKKFSVYPVPNTRPWLRGLVNLRGNLIPVYDVAMLFGLSAAPASYENLLILDKGVNAVGILINKLPQVCDVENWQALDQAAVVMPGLEKFIKESYRHDDKVWSCFDHREYFESVKHDVAV